MLPRVLLVLACLAFAAPGAAGQRAAVEDGIATLLAYLEQTGLTGDRGAMIAVGSRSASTPGLADFANVTDPAPTRFIIKERDRTPLEDGSQRLLVEVFVQRGNEAQITTWRLDAMPATGREPLR